MPRLFLGAANQLSGHQHLVLAILLLTVSNNQSRQVDAGNPLSGMPTTISVQQVSQNITSTPLIYQLSSRVVTYCSDRVSAIPGPGRFFGSSSSLYPFHDQ